MIWTSLVVQWLRFASQGRKFNFLVWELRSHMLCGAAKAKQKTQAMLVSERKQEEG